MAISTYAELQAAVINWLGREGDTTISAIVPSAIALAEAKINRHLRVAEMEATATGTSDNGILAIPTDYLAWRRVEAVPYGALEYVTPDWASRTYPTVEGGIPSYFTVQGSTLTTFPAYTGEVALDYYQKIPALSDTNTTNWLLTSHPDIYLFMTLSEVNAFTKDAEAAVLWNQRGMAAVEEVKSADVSRRYSRVTARVRGPTP